STDDAEGEITATASAAKVTDEALRAAVIELTGPIEQIPPQVSAIKVDGQRAYKRARAGEDVALKPRPVTVYDFAINELRRDGHLLDVTATITCSSGTYIRALARDLGNRLGAGGHLTYLRRTHVGPYDLPLAHTIEQLNEELTVLPMAEAVAAAFPRLD